MSSSRLIVTGGPITTFDSALPTASSVVFEAGRIAEVRPPGAPAPAVARGDRRLDLGGAQLLPGLIDAHTHLVHWGLRALRLDLSSVRTPAEALEQVAERHATLEPGRVMIAEGWDESLWSPPRFPTRQELDRVSGERPIVLRRVCGHLSVANSAALAHFSDDPEIDRASGTLLEEASMSLSRVFPPSEAELDEAVRSAIASYHAFGVTAVHDMSTPEHLRAYARVEAQGPLRLAIAVILTRPHLARLVEAGLGAGWRRGALRLWGVKFFADGSIGARTAALSDDYADFPGERGQLLIPPDELAAEARRAESAGIPLAVHAIGDRAVGAVIDAFEAALGGVPSRLGHRIEHLEMVDDAGLARMRALGLVASMQPNFVSRWGMPDQMYAARLGWERARRMNPFRRVLEAQVPLAFGSDAMPAGALAGCAAAVAAPDAGQRLTPIEALAAYTSGAARAAGDDRRGRLAVGCSADAVVIAGNLEKLESCRVVTTIAGGEIVFEAAGAGSKPVSR